MSGDLVAKGAREPRIGLWDHALEEPNLEDATFAHGLSALAQIPGLRALEGSYRKKLRLKSWQYMTASNAELFVAFVVGTAGFASNAFIYIVERGSGRVHKRFAITPLGRGTSLSPTSARGSHHFEGGGLAIDIANQDGGRRFTARIETQTEGDDMPLRVDLEFASAPGDEHFAICTPLEERPDAHASEGSIEGPTRTRWNYTHKFGAFAVSGTIELGARKIDMAGAFGTVDFTKSYALRHAVWRWVALAGRTTTGEILGINLIDPTPDAPISENYAWLGGVRIPLTGVSITVATPGEPTSTWAARAGQAQLVKPGAPSTGAAQLELTGTPIGHVEQRLDVPLVRHRLLHCVTNFAGTLRLADGTAHAFADIGGIAEDNDTWW